MAPEEEVLSPEEFIARERSLEPLYEGVTKHIIRYALKQGRLVSLREVKDLLKHVSGHDMPKTMYHHLLLRKKADMLLEEIRYGRPEFEITFVHSKKDSFFAVKKTNSL